ncbi:PQQ-binding-like beta-propeller repeat protein [Dactylosporangium sp. NPDC051541]|uniref:outer membrane protein assembly factor BamB family protein n=1 Tax=Dactylosporangium sp. NPDC051541 TaxID=3363977 RepID=UPI0037988366
MTMTRRTLLRAAGAAAGAVAVGGAAVWFGGRGSEPAPPGHDTPPRWRVAAADQPDTLLLSGDTLLALGDGLTAFNAATGAVRWHQDLGRNTVLPARLRTPPLRAAGDTLAYRTQDAGKIQIRTAKLLDGTERWRRDFEQYVGDLAATASGLVVAVSDAADGRGLSGFDGPADRWRQAVPVSDGPLDLLADDLTVYAAARELVAFDAAAGSRKWSLDSADGYVFGRPAVHGNLLVAFGMRYVDDEYLYRLENLFAVDAAAGTVRWEYDPPGGHLVDAVPIVTGRGIVAVHEDGTLTGLDPDTGAERWNFVWDFADIIALGEHVYVATADGVAELDPGTGRRLKLLNEPNAYKLAGLGGRLCVASANGLSGYDV